MEYLMRFTDQACLSQPGLSQRENNAPQSLSQTCHHISQGEQFPLASHHRGMQAFNPARADRFEFSPDYLIGKHRLILSLDRDPSQRLKFKKVLDQFIR